MDASSRPKRNVVFIHPDLGIGGAERLVVDAAVGLQSQGHKVAVFTSHCNPRHSFEETKDGTLDVRVRGDAIFPPSIAGRFNILCAILRQFALLFGTSVLSNELQNLQPDVFIIDQLSACVPLFRIIFPRARFLFYCHYPDKLLIRQDDGWTKRVKDLYRVPFDALEGWSTACSDSIVVNSKYTRSVVRHTLKSVKSRDLRVIYPCVNASSDFSDRGTPLSFGKQKQLLLSINRFERKKNLALAIQAYAGLSEKERSRAILVIAGGFDPRNAENAISLKALEDLATALGLRSRTIRETQRLEESTDLTHMDIIFLLSVPNDLKDRLLRSAKLLIYTPTNEHFGIVPLEAMLAGVPVLATNTGGPLETIYDGRTGWLRHPEKVDQWTDVLRKPLIPSSAETLRAMGQRGKERVVNEFSLTRMTEEFGKEIERLVSSTAPRPQILPTWVAATLSALLIVVLSILTLSFNLK